MIYSHMFPVGDKNQIIEKEQQMKVRRPAGELSEDDLEKYAGKESSFNMATLMNHVVIQAILRGYRRRGYLLADFDPLYSIIKEKGYTDEKPPPLVLRQHIFPEKEKHKFILPENTFLCAERVVSLAELIKHLHRAYCGTIGADYMDDYTFGPKSYLRMNIEWPNREYMTVEEHKVAVHKLLRAQALDDLVLDKYPDFWHYSMRGCETGVLIADFVVRKGAAAGFDSFVLGMPEFGRLAFLMNAMNRSPKELLSTMVSKQSHSWANWYTLGATHTLENIFDTQTNNLATILLLQQHDGGDSYFPVTLGRTKAMQLYDYDFDGNRSMAIIVHKPSSVECSTTTFETIKLLKMPEYEVKGAIHIVINNQVGYTREIMSETGTTFCTDSFKVCRIPVLHVNATDIEAVMFCVNLAVDYKRRFNRDIVIDLVGFNIPPKTEKVRQDTWLRRRLTDQRTFLEKYKVELNSRKIVNTSEWEELEEQYKKEMETAYEEAKLMEHPDPKLWTQCLSPWLLQETEEKYTTTNPVTGVEWSMLSEISKVMSQWPQNFNIRDEDKVELLEKGLQFKEDKLDYDLCEILAVGSIMNERTHVRIVGMHIRERNYVLIDKDDSDKVAELLNIHLKNKGAKCTVNHLTGHRQQNGALGFEIGFSFCDKKQLLIYEFPRNADRVSTCQPMFFSYLAAPSQPYTKSSIVLVIPHCQGISKDYDSALGWPRKLSMLTDEEEKSDTLTKTDLQKLKECNFQLASVSSPAQYFHFLRRQLHIPYSRPLVLYISDCDTDIVDNFSSTDDITGSTMAQVLMQDKETVGNNVKKLVLCTGHIYNLIKWEREKQGMTSMVAVVSIELWHPFPYRELKEVLNSCPNAELCYAQVEEFHTGWWHAIKRKIPLIDPNRAISLHVLFSESGKDTENLLKPLFSIK